MIRINLLPHRAMRRAARARQFGAMAGLAAVVGVAVALAVHAFNAGRIDNQNDRNNLLAAEIAKLDKQIEEIKQLKEQTEQLLARKQAVERLQTNRNDAVRIMDQLLRQLPDGTYLKAIKQTGDTINITGFAQSNARVSTLMRSMNDSPWLEAPRLIEIKSANVNNIRANEFSMDVKVKRPKPEDAGSKPKDKKT